MYVAIRAKLIRQMMGRICNCLEFALVAQSELMRALTLSLASHTYIQSHLQQHHINIRSTRRAASNSSLLSHALTFAVCIYLIRFVFHRCCRDKFRFALQKLIAYTRSIKTDEAHQIIIFNCTMHRCAAVKVSRAL